MSEKIKNVNAENLEKFASLVKGTINNSINDKIGSLDVSNDNSFGTFGVVQAIGQTDGKIIPQYSKNLTIDKISGASGDYVEFHNSWGINLNSSSAINLTSNEIYFTNGFNEPQDDIDFPVLFSDVDDNVDAFIGKNDSFTYNSNSGKLKVSGMAYGTSNTTDTTVVNLGSMKNYAAPISHASSSSTYGLGTTSNYGHVKYVSNDIENSSVSGNGVVAGKSHYHRSSLILNVDKIAGASTSSNLNNITVGGSYYISSSKTNAPFNNAQGILYVIDSGDLTTLDQIFMTSVGDIFSRHRNVQGIWEKWVLSMQTKVPNFLYIDQHKSDNINLGITYDAVNKTVKVNSSTLSVGDVYEFDIIAGTSNTTNNVYFYFGPDSVIKNNDITTWSGWAELTVGDSPSAFNKRVYFNNSKLKNIAFSTGMKLHGSIVSGGDVHRVKGIIWRVS